MEPVFQALGTHWGDPTTEPGRSPIFDRVIEPVCLLGSVGRVRSAGRKRTWDRRTAGIHGAILPFPSPVVCGPGYPFFWIACRRFLFARSSAGGGQCKFPAISTS